MRDRQFREVNRHLNPRLSSPHRPPVVRLLAHDDSLNRRLGWRFGERGYCVISETFAEFSAKAITDEDLRDELRIVDIGSEPTLAVASLNIVFAWTRSSAPVWSVVLVPWFDPASRPEWAEVGLRLVFDRTTPPPEIVETAIAWHSRTQG